MRRFALRLALDLVLVGSIVLILTGGWPVRSARQESANVGPDIEAPTANAPAVQAGELVRGHGPGVFLISSRQSKQLVLSPEAFADCGWEWEMVRSVPDWLIGQLEDGPHVAGCDLVVAEPTQLRLITVQAGDLVRGNEAPVYFLDEQLHKRWVRSPEAFFSCGWRWQDVRLLPNRILARLQSGPEMPPC